MLATAVPKVKAATKLKNAAQMTALPGESTRVETTASAVIVHHVLSRETIPWADIAAFEIHPTPTRRGSNVFARTTLGRLIRVRTFVPARPSTDHRAAAEAFRDWIETDRRQRRTVPSAA